jgi:predicted component of type VI protein secretion system
MPAQLVALTDGPSILLDKPILLFGRHPECDIQIDSRKISRRHCCIAQVSDYLVVRDLGSTNGIRINNVRVLEGRLRNGDELTIGGNRYQVCWDVSEAAALQADLARRKASPDRPNPAIRAGDDELLESCDEPVPLREDRGASEAEPTPRREEFASLIGRPPPAAAKPAPPPPPPSLPAPPPAKPQAKPFVLPDEMELLPTSDLDLPEPRPPRRSPA